MTKEVDSKKLEMILEMYPDEELLKADGFDSAVLGVVYDKNGGVYKLVYSIIFLQGHAKLYQLTLLRPCYFCRFHLRTIKYPPSRTDHQTVPDLLSIRKILLIGEIPQDMAALKPLHSLSNLHVQFGLVLLVLLILSLLKL